MPTDPYATPTDQATALELAASALVGTPFAHGGRDPATALDCWGLVIVLYRGVLGAVLPDYPVDGSRERRAAAAAQIEIDTAARWDSIGAGAEQPGDVVLLRRHGRPLHVGVVLPGARMAHADAPAGVTIERYDSLRWADLICGFYRLRPAA